MPEREILFRGKRVDNGEWVEGFYYKAKFYATDKELCDYITVPHLEEEGRRSDHFMIIPETRGEYTGLTDKNGVKIFEGDILKLHSDYYNFSILRKVVISNGNTYAINHGFAQNLYIKFISSKHWEVEVIGNIHDNPELLKEQEQ